MKSCARTICCTIAMLAAGMLFSAFAGGPLYVTGPSAVTPGEPYRWAGSSIRYKTDQGGLGNRTNAEADAMVSAAFQVWEDVDTASIGFQNDGKLSSDITAVNILGFQNALGMCSDASQPSGAIVYDLDGSIIEALGMDKNSVLGFAGAVCTNDRLGTYTRGWAVMNGRFIDGEPDSAGHQSVTLDEFHGVFVHEFGHLIGLGHSQINVGCATDCSAEDLSGVPTMFPLLVGDGQATLNTDDISMLSSLYPESSFHPSRGRIQGRVVFSDGVTPAQGYNVIARNTADPRVTAVSSVSGYRFTAGAGNPLVPLGMDTSFFYGSHDQNLIGFYDIPGLPPGTYTVEVEAILNSDPVPFVYESGVGPIGDYLGFQYKMPGSCDVQYLHHPPRPTDDCGTRTTVSVGPGQVLSTGTDIVLIGTGPRCDAWEGEGE
jgi:hypothetical protein